MNEEKLNSNIVRKETILGSLDDFRALMYEIYQQQPQFREDKLFLQGERKPADCPENMNRWEVTLGGTLHKRGFILARQLPNRTTQLQFAYYSKFQSIGPEFEVDFANHIISQANIIEVEKSVQVNRQKLLQNLKDSFNLEELHQLAFKMRIQHEDFTNKLSPFIRELIGHCERHERIKELIEICQDEHPDLVWE